MTKNQPHIRIQPGKITRWIDGATWVMLLCLWIMTVMFYTQLPDQIPSHLNAKGAVDDYSDEMILLFLAFLVTAMVALLSYVNRYPHKFNYIVKITDDNAPFQYSNAILMVSVIKLTIVLVFCISAMILYLTGSGKLGDPGPVLVIGLVMLVQLPTFYLLYRSVKNG